MIKFLNWIFFLNNQLKKLQGLTINLDRSLYFDKIVITGKGFN